MELTPFRWTHSLWGGRSPTIGEEGVQRCEPSIARSLTSGANRLVFFQDSILSQIGVSGNPGAVQTGRRALFRRQWGDQYASARAPCYSRNELLPAEDSRPTTRRAHRMAKATLTASIFAETPAFLFCFQCKGTETT